MIEWLNILFDSRLFLRINAVVGFLFLGFFVFFYFPIIIRVVYE